MKKECMPYSHISQFNGIKRFHYLFNMIMLVKKSLLKVTIFKPNKNGTCFQNIRNKILK